MSEVSPPNFLQRLKGRGYKNRLFHPHDELWDCLLGVRTFGFRDAVGNSSDADWRGHYVPTSYRHLFQMLKHVKLDTNDVFVDLGSGLGRAVFAASYMGAKQAVGVEIDADLCRNALETLGHSRLSRRNVSFVCTGAESYAFDDCTVLFIFNSFGVGTMRAVIENVEASLRRRPRDIRIIYFNPSFAAPLEESKLLMKYDFWPGIMGKRYAASFWRSSNERTN